MAREASSSGIGSVGSNRQPRRRPLIGRGAAAVRRAAGTALAALRSSDGPAMAQAVAAPIEQLEQRRLLTTIASGETAQILTPGDDEGSEVRISFSGEGTATLVGSYTNEFGEAELTALPATVFGPDGERRELGGIGGAQGVRPISDFSGDDNFGFTEFTPDSVDFLFNLAPRLPIDGGGFGIRVRDFDAFAPGNLLEFTSIAANQDGLLFGVFQYNLPLQRGDDEQDVPLLFLGRFDTATGAVIIQQDLTIPVLQQVVPFTDPSQDREFEDFAGLIDNVIGADFDFVTGDFYFGINAQQFLPSVNGDPAEISTPILFRIVAPEGGFTTRGSSTSGDLIRQEGAFGQFVIEGPVFVDGFTFDTDANLKVHGTRFSGDGRGDDSVGFARRGIYTIERNSGGTVFDTDTFDDQGFDDLDGIGALIPVLTPASSSGSTAEAEPESEVITSFNGFEAVPGQRGFVYAIIGDGEDGQFIRINLNDLINAGEGSVGIAASTSLGPLQDPDGAIPIRGLDESRVPGAQVRGLTFSPNVRSLFRLEDGNPGNDDERGAFLGTDTNTDQLLLIDERLRPQTADLYAVLLDVDDPLARITIATDDDDDGTFTIDDAGQVIVNTASGEFEVNGAGSVFIGGRQFAPGPDDDDGEATDPIALPQDSLDFSDFFDNNGFLPADFGIRGRDRFAPGLYSTGTMGRVFVDGVITGRVNIEGSIDTFYAGSILTGSAGGVPIGGPSTLASNFAVNGDVRQIVSISSIGGSQALGYRTGFDMAIAGNVGQIISTSGGFTGSGLVLNDPNTPGLTTDYVEIESDLEGVYSNNSFDTPEILGTGQVESLDFEGGAVRVIGEGGDVDFYGVPLLAGQTITIDFDSPSGKVAVFDPNGVLRASNANDLVDNDQFFGGLGPAFVPVDTPRGESLQFTAQMPGIYRVAVGGFLSSGAFGSGDFVTINNSLTQGVGGTERQTYGQIGSGSNSTYVLTLRGVDNMSLGGIAPRGGSIFLDGLQPLEIRNGDLGALLSPGFVFAQPVFDLETSSFGANLRVPQGNIREIAGSSVGTLNFPINLDAPAGTVGRVKAFGVLGDDDAPADVILNVFSGVTRDPADLLFDPAVAVNNYQLIDAPGTFNGSLLANGEIGVVRAGEIGTLGGRNTNPIFAANVDGLGIDGTIHLIDVLGDMGNSVSGGPIFSTGPGGNVRYIRVGGLAYKDPLFGGGLPDTVNIDNGGETVLRDDSGTNVEIKFAQGLQVGFDPTFGPLTTGGTSGTIRTLPVRGASPTGGPGGGRVILDINANGSFEVEAENGFNSRAEIGSIFLSNSQTTDVVFDTPFAPNDDDDGDGGGGDGGGGGGGGGGFGAPGFGRQAPPGLGVRPFPRPDSPAPIGFGEDDLDPLFSNLVTGAELRLERVTDFESQLLRTTTLNFEGKRVDVLNIQAGPMDEIVNDTLGELVSVEATSIGLLEAQNIGFGRSAAGTKLDPIRNLLPDQFGVYPNQLTTGVLVGEAVEIAARESLGNINAFTDFNTRRPNLGVPAEGNDGGGGGGAGGGGDGPVSEADGIVSGSIQRIVANSDNTNAVGVFEGIVGPLVAANPDQTTSLPGHGQLREVYVGEGLSPSGTGAVPGAGVYARGVIGLVEAENADIRGDVISQLGIDEISVTNGSIIGSDISVIGGFRASSTDFPMGQFDSTNEFGINVLPFGVVPDELEILTTDDDPTFVDSDGQRVYEIDEINVNNGLVIGTKINTFDTDEINLGDSLGLLNSVVATLGDSRIESVVAGGLGIRNSQIGGGESIGSVLAQGTGELIDVAKFPAAVTAAGRGVFDPVTGQSVDGFSDVFFATGTGLRTSKVSGVTNSGVMQNTRVFSNGNIDEVGGFAILGRSEVDVNRAAYPSRISAGGVIGTVATRGAIEGLQLTGGQVNNLITGGSLADTQVNVSGVLGDVDVGSDVSSDVRLFIDGPDGRIESIRTGGDLFGTIVTYNNLSKLNVGGDYRAELRVRRGGIGQAIFSGNYLTGGNIIADGTIDQLFINGDLQEDSQVKAGGFGDIEINGVINGILVNA